MKSPLHRRRFRMILHAMLEGEADSVSSRSVLRELTSGPDSRFTPVVALVACDCCIPESINLETFGAQVGAVQAVAALPFNDRQGRTT